jgi:hypothetical protein
MGWPEAIARNAGDDVRETLDGLTAELQAGLERYWKAAGRILDNSGIVLHAPPVDYLAFEKNVFSILFLYSYYRAGIAPDRRCYYAAVNQCLRGMVTGCDNILDGEYKQTLDTDLPVKAVRFRSIVDIMVSDRVLFEILLDLADSYHLPSSIIRKASAASLRALTGSGAQEASEEDGVEDIPAPDNVLKDIHHYKTGILFQCPWAVPGVVEKDLGETAGNLRMSLYQIGMGCQLFDDIVDLPGDVRERRYNYAWSTIFHGADAATRKSLRNLYGPSLSSREQSLDLRAVFAEAIEAVANEGSAKLEAGLNGLLREHHRHLVIPLMSLIIRRIGVDRFLPGKSSE